MTIVLIEKLNSGASFRVVLKSGEPTTRKITQKDRSVLYAAFEWYCSEVLKAAEENGVSITDPSENIVKMSKLTAELFLPLEPWGFAYGSFESPFMHDTGSTPSSHRAKVLLCYQAPLQAKQSGRYTTFSRTVNVAPSGRSGAGAYEMKCSPSELQLHESQEHLKDWKIVS